MVGMKHIAHVHRTLLFGGRFFAVDQVKEIGGFTQSGVGRQQRFALACAMKISGDDGNLRDQLSRLVPL